MKKWLLVPAVALLATIVLPALPAQAGVNVRLEAFYPVKDAQPDFAFPQAGNNLGYRWAPMPCNGSAVLSGVSNVRFVGYATSTTAQTDAQFVVNYGAGSLVDGNAWYQSTYADLPANTEVKVIDMVQDLSSVASQFNLRFRRGLSQTTTCGFTANNVPSTNEGFISPRSTPASLATNLRIEAFDVATGLPLRCGTSDFATRVKAIFYASGSGMYDFHAHVETNGVEGTGPNQSLDGNGGRYWEMATNRAVLPATAEVGLAVFSLTGTHGEVHFAQQTAAGQAKNEVFCSLG